MLTSYVSCQSADERILELETQRDGLKLELQDANARVKDASARSAELAIALDAVKQQLEEERAKVGFRMQMISYMTSESSFTLT